MPHQYPALALTLVLALGLSACTPRSLLLGSGAGVGTASMQERGLRGAADDYNLRLLINDAIFKDSIALYQRISLLISSGRIVLIGRVNSEGQRTHAQMLTETAAARPVINRLTVGPDLGLVRGIRDSGISAQLDSALLFDRDVAAVNYDVETRNGVVYVIGEARSEAEQRRVLYLAGQTPGVTAVESYISLPDGETGAVR